MDWLEVVGMVFSLAGGLAVVVLGVYFVLLVLRALRKYTSKS